VKTGFSSLFLSAALAFWGYGAAQDSGGSPASNAGRLLTVLNPAVESKMAQRLPLAPRLDSLEGKTIYLVDINWGGSEAAYSVFEEIQLWFSKNMPSVKTIIKLKKGGYGSDDPALWKEIAQKGNAAILGVSG